MKPNKYLIFFLSTFSITTSSIFANSMLVAENPTSTQSNSHSDSTKNQTSYISEDQAQFYIGGGVGAGRIDTGTCDVLTSYLLEPLASLVLNTQARSGGFSWKGYVGATAKINKFVRMGAEIGFSWYPETKVTFNIPNFSDVSEALDISGTFLNGGIRFKGYGIDLLYNITFNISNNFYFGLKPGFQFAYQNSKLFVNSDADDLQLALSTKYRVYKFLPQVVLDTGYEFNTSKLGSWDMKKIPFFIEIYYQHVFGNDDSNVNKRVSSRDAVGGSMGIKF
jgi:hypothetical protein